jgi:hypothetical protein
MTPDECVAHVKALLPSLPASRLFNIVAHAQPPRALPGSRAGPSPPAPAGSLPELHVCCRERAADDPAAGVNGYFEGAPRAALPERMFPLVGEAPPPPAFAGNVHMLADTLESAAQLGHLLRHELVHAADHAVHGLDLTTCAGVACSEVRAAAAGHCAEWPPGSRDACALKSATDSTRRIFPAFGANCVRLVYKECRDVDAEASPLAAVQRVLAQERCKA